MKAARPHAPAATVIPDPAHSTPFVTAWAAPSRTHPDVTYTVRFDRLANEWSCHCAGYTYRGHCQHVEQAMAALVAAWRSGRKAGRAA